MRRACEAQYDLEAPGYDEVGGIYSNNAHRQFVREFLGRLPEKSTIHDAPCGTGRYLPISSNDATSPGMDAAGRI